MSEDMMTAFHEAGHAIARIEIEAARPDLIAPEPLLLVSIISDAARHGYAAMPARITSIDDVRDIDELIDYRARLKARVGFSKSKLYQTVEADIIEILAGQVAEEVAEKNRCLEDEDIEEFALHCAGDGWLFENDIDDITRIQKRMALLQYDYVKSSKIVVHTISLLRCDTDFGRTKICEIAKILMSRKIMSGDDFREIWRKIS
ncbi:Hypothetical protein APM_2927 [Acidiphilium sp. PM]|nr:Hypothetical protein APM_2927 [Acidiphilium sp. PM]